MSGPPSLFDAPEPTGKDFPDRRLSRPFTTVRGPTADAVLGSPTSSDVLLAESDTNAAFEYKAEAWQRLKAQPWHRRREPRVERQLGMPGPSACSHGFAPIHPDGVRRCSWCAVVLPSVTP